MEGGARYVWMRLRKARAYFPPRSRSCYGIIDIPKGACPVFYFRYSKKNVNKGKLYILVSGLSFKRTLWALMGTFAGKVRSEERRQDEADDRDSCVLHLLLKGEIFP
jgi:hypothetical protein